MLNPLPLHSLTLDLDTPQNTTLSVAPQLRREDALVPAVHPKGARVRLVSLDVHAPVPLVEQADETLVRAGGHGDGDRQGLRQRRIKAVEGQVGAIDGPPAGERDGEGR